MKNPRLLPAVVLAWALLVALSTGAAAQTGKARATEELRRLWRETGVPSIAVAVARDQKLLFSDGIGYADLESLSRAGPTTVYNIGSISKVMAAVAVLQLVERGEVSLDDPIQKYLPAFPDKGTPITLRHLMTHTSGIRHYRPDDFPGEPWADNVATYDSIEAAVEIFEDDPLLFAPGEYYRYSSYAVNLLQGVVEAASGLGFEVYMRRRVWAPAGMLSSSFDLPERIVTGRARGYEIVDGEVVNYYPNENVTYKFAGGGMLSTVEDLVRFGVAITSHRLLGEEISTEMLEPQLDDIQVFEGEDPPSDLRWEQALMWRIRRDEADRPYLHHCGQVKGFNACLIIYRDEDLIVAIIDNGSGGAADLRGARGFAEIFRREEGGESLE